MSDKPQFYSKMKLINRGVINSKGSAEFKQKKKSISYERQVQVLALTKLVHKNYKFPGGMGNRYANGGNWAYETTFDLDYSGDQHTVRRDGPLILALYGRHQRHSQRKTTVSPPPSEAFPLRVLPTAAISALDQTLLRCWLRRARGREHKRTEAATENLDYTGGRLVV